MVFRALLLLAAAVIVVLLLMYSVSRQRRFLAWALFIGKLTLGLAVLFGLFYVLERLILL